MLERIIKNNELLLKDRKHLSLPYDFDFLARAKPRSLCGGGGGEGRGGGDGEIRGGPPRLIRNRFVMCKGVVRRTNQTNGSSFSDFFTHTTLVVFLSL